MPLAPIRLNISAAAVAGASNVRTLLKDLNRERDTKGGSPMHPPASRF